MTEDTEEDVSLARRIPWRRLANIVGLLLILAVVVPFLVYAVPQVVGAEQSYVVLSGSMQPAMNPGDAIIVDDVPASEIAEGDVITYAESGSDRPTTHRVIEVVEQNGDTAFRTQGDNNPNPDPSLVTPADLEGKVLSVGGFLVVIPLIGYVIQFASTPLGLVALLILPLGALVVSEIWDVVAAASGGGSSESAAAADDEDDEGGDAHEVTDATAVEGSAEHGDGTADGETVLGPGADGETVTIEELARRVEERPESTGVSAADDADTGAAAIEGEEAEAPEAEEGAGETDERERSEKAGSREETSEDEASEDEEGLVFSAAELQLGLAVLVAFFAYSAWVAYATFFEVWAFAVAASVAAALLLLGGLYVVGGEAEAAEPATRDEQRETAAEDDSETPATGDGEPTTAAGEEAIPSRAEPDATTGADGTRGDPEVDVEDLLSLGEASGVDPQRDAPDLTGAEDVLEEDGQRADAESPEVSDDD
jgi:signal peptidase